MNQLSDFYLCPLRLNDMNFGEISKHLCRCPSLIVPVGSMEPIGLYAVTGILTRCGEVLAEALSSKLQVLTAPPINYSCTTAFKSFEGCAGIKQRTFINMLTEICRDWIFQGFRRILLLSVSSENDAALEIAMKRLNHNGEKVKCFSLLSDTRMADQLSRYRVGKELGRSEYLILSLARFLFPELLRDIHQGNARRLPEPGEYQTWKKRGKDPQLFRKMFPNGSTSEVAEEQNIETGRDLFGYIMKILEDEYSPFLIVPQNAT